MVKTKIGIIGGSGLYNIEGLKDIKELKINTPFGKPSDKYVIARYGDVEIAFLPRHGKGHIYLPSQINYRANIYGMKKLGVESIISVSAVGSLKTNIKPLDIVIPDQFFDRTNQARKSTFFDEGIVAHISFSDPTCPVLNKILYQASTSLGISTHLGGAYVNMEGPAFSTKAESFFYKNIGMSIIGMTNLQEAKLAREAEICYSTIALVTDYDCWHEDARAHVTVDLIIQNLMKNVKNAKKIIKLVLPKIPRKRDCVCANALKDAIITSRDHISETTRNRLDIIIRRYIIKQKRTEWLQQRTDWL